MEELLMINRQDIVSIADAIRSKTNTTDEMTISEMVANIAGMNNSSSGSSQLDMGSFTYTIERDYEPGTDLYTLTSSDLKTSSRNLIIIHAMVDDDGGVVDRELYVIYRQSKEDAFTIKSTYLYNVRPGAIHSIVNDDYINCSLSPDSNVLVYNFRFIAI